MPKYLVEMTDGRKFQVDADSPPTEDEVLAHLGGSSPTAPAGEMPTSSAQMRPPNVTSDATTPREPDTWLGGAVKGLSDYAGELGQSLFKSAAQPETTGDFLGLMVPGMAGQGKALGVAAGHQGRAFLRGSKGAPTMRQGIGRGVMEMARDAVGGPKADAAAVDKFRGGPAPVAPPPVAPTVRTGTLRMDPVDKMMASARPEPSRATLQMGPPPPAPQGHVGTLRMAPEPTAPVGLSEADRAQLARRYPGLDPAKVEQQLGGPPAPSPQLPEAWKPLTDPPLQAPRVEVGAEQVGRGVGKTKEQVRAETNPILGEEPGAASPILPQGPLGRIVDALKALPPGAEREAYVARATSGKAQWQIENIRRTLEHLGLLVPVAAAAPTVRDEVMKRLSGGQ